VRNVREFLDALGKLPVGGSVKLTVIRGQQSLQYTVRNSPNKSGD
jgi:S1-C subfamily serine protease